MKISEEISKEWKESLEKGDSKTLAIKLKMDDSTISRIINGKQHTTSSNLLKIKAFIEKKKKMIAKIEQDQD